jgi:hypothetical protein
LQEKYPENWQEQPFDGQIAYNIGGGLPHGRLAIGNGAVNKATIIDASKASGTRPATSRAFQNLLARYEESLANVGRLTEQNNTLVQQNAALTQDVKRNCHVLEIQFCFGALPVYSLRFINIDYVSSLAAHYKQSTNRDTTRPTSGRRK